MKKFFLIVFIFLDIVILGVAVLFLYAHMKGSLPASMSAIPGLPSSLNSSSTPTAAPGSVPATASTASTDTVKMVTPSAINPVNTAGSVSSRKILFTYRNSHAKKVMVRADFTGWRAEPMDKDSAGTWRYMAILEPGEYAYCYSVDDKSIRDPANKHTKTVGKTVVSSIIVQPQTVPQH